MARGKFEEWITPDGLLRIKSWARDGLTDAQIASNIGVSRTTLFSWRKKYPELEKAIKEGKAPVDIEVENALLKRALGEFVEEEETIIEQVGDSPPKKRAVKRKRYIPPDTTAQIFWLKNRKPNEWLQVSPAEKAKLEVEAKKLEVELMKLQEELEEIKQSKDTQIVIIDEWGNEDED